MQIYWNIWNCSIDRWQVKLQLNWCTKTMKFILFLSGKWASLGNVHGIWPVAWFLAEPYWDQVLDNWGQNAAMFDSWIYATVRWPLHSKLFPMAAWLSASFISSATVFTRFNLLWSNIHEVWKGRALPLLDIPCSGVLPSCLVVWPLFHNANDKLLEVWGKPVDDPKIESRYTDEISIGENWNWISESETTSNKHQVASAFSQVFSP